MHILFITEDDGATSITEDIGRECDSDSECLPSRECQYYQEQLVYLKTLTDRSLRSKVIKKLRELICNKKQRGICCPRANNSEDCGKPQIHERTTTFSKSD